MTVNIVVAGDVSVDWYYWPRPPSTNHEDLNWKLYKGISLVPQKGGAALLFEMLHDRLQIGIDNSLYSIASQNFNNLVEKGPKEVLHTNVELDLFPLFPCENHRKEVENYRLFPCNNPKKDDKTYRVKNYLGYTTPDINQCKDSKWCPKPPEMLNDKDDADFVIIYDSGNGFRFNKSTNSSEIMPDNWPKALAEGKKPIVIYNMYPPLFQGSLWDHIIKYHKEKLILILNADDLRKKGINISRSISWEKSSLEFLWEMNNNLELKEKIRELKNVIVRFKFEGAIHYKGKTKKPDLYFDPYSLEGGFWNSGKFGDMRAVTLVFLSTLSSYLISNYEINKDCQANIGEGIKQSLKKSRMFLVNGYGNDEGNPKFFKQDLAQMQDTISLPTDHIICTSLPEIENVEEDCLIKNYKNGRVKYFWSILKEKTDYDDKKKINLEELTSKIVKQGVSALEHFPVGSFRKLTTVDRAEIESFRSIMNVMEEYLHSKKSQKPLSIAVFGSPGSGKSFGITEIAKSIDNEKIVEVAFNISQFTTTEHLTHAFHKVRDISLEGKIPLVFFDEFDCKFNNENLGWIKYFLVPMQDGEFMDCENMHPIGKSIFVFAGGTCATFKKFCELCNCHSDIKGESTESACKMSNKCPDFLSRLRGYVNILGPNQINEDDEAYIIRRAILLRSQIEKSAPDIIDSSGTIKIDDKLLKALIYGPDYIHGVRSMQAIVEMSMLRGESSWQKAFLPPKDQLESHIKDTKEFYRLLAQN